MRKSWNENIKEICYYSLILSLLRIACVLLLFAMFCFCSVAFVYSVQSFSLNKNVSNWNEMRHTHIHTQTQCDNSMPSNVVFKIALQNFHFVRSRISLCCFWFQCKYASKIRRLNKVFTSKWMFSQSVDFQSRKIDCKLFVIIEEVKRDRRNEQRYFKGHDNYNSSAEKTASNDELFQY